MTTAFNADGSNLQKPALGKALFGDNKDVAFGAGPASASDAKMAKQVAETFTMRRSDGLAPAGLGGFTPSAETPTVLKPLDASSPAPTKEDAKSPTNPLEATKPGDLKSEDAKRGDLKSDTKTTETDKPETSKNPFTSITDLFNKDPKSTSSETSPAKEVAKAEEVKKTEIRKAEIRRTEETFNYYSRMAEAEKVYVDERKETLKAAKATEGKAKEDQVEAEALKAEKAAQAETRSVTLSEYQSLEVVAGDKLSDGRVSQDELNAIMKALETQREEALVEFQSSQATQKEETKDKLSAISLKLEDVGNIMSRFNESENSVNPFAPTEDSPFNDIVTRGPEKRFI